MGIRFTCPNGHKLHVKSHLAGKRGVCPQCGAKTTIPLEGQPEQLEPPGLPKVNQDASVASSVTLVGPLPASPSIVIAVSDSVSTTTAANTAAPVPPPIVPTSPPAGANAPVMPTIAPPLATVQPFIVPDAVEPVSPAARYVARRERNRRHQFTFAVMLLFAVIVLAGVLIFVLQRGAGSAPANNSQSVGLSELAPSRHVAATSDPIHNAHSAAAVN